MDVEHYFQQSLFCRQEMFSMYRNSLFW